MPMIETLKPHQDDGANFLATQKKGALWWVVGAGKTHATLKALEILGPKAGPVLIIGPPISLGMWADEVAENLGWSVQRIKTGKDVLRTDAQVTVISYALAVAMKDELLGRHDTVICDEAHYLKTATSQRTRAILGHRNDGRRCIIEGATHVWLLTGTPMTRYADDLFPPLRALAPECLPASDGGVMNLYKFRERYCATEERRIGTRTIRTVVGNLREDELRTKIGGFASRHDTIPDFNVPLLVDVVSLDLGAIKMPDDPAFTFLRGAMDLYSHDPSSQHRKLVMARLRELSGGHIASLRRMFGTLKAETCAEYIAEQDDGPAVVFYWHRDVGEIVVDALTPIFAVRDINGNTPQKTREWIIDNWNDGHTDYLCGQIAALGVSANLQQGGHRAYVVEEDWSPATMQQALGRLHRMGQTHPVRATILAVANSVDEVVALSQTHKLRGINKLIWEKEE